MHKQIVKYSGFLLIFGLLLSSCHLYLFDRTEPTTKELRDRFAVSLSSTWNVEEVKILLATLDTFYQNGEDHSRTMTPSVWKLSDEGIQDDVKIEIVNSVKLVTVSKDAFSVVDTDPESQANTRLFRVVARFITDNWTDINATKLVLKDGSNRDAIELVLKEMYGLSIVRKGTPEADKIAQRLRKYVGEVIVSEFTNEDLMMLMSVYELLPRGLDRIPKMKHLLCRQKAPYAGSAWIVADCIEYDGRTFRIKNPNEFKRIIIHEKAHFLWEYALTGKLRKAWSELGGWHKDPNNRNRWLKSKTRDEFVTDYAYAKNPNEDWAESVAFYIIRPDKLRSCSAAKFNFIDGVMQQYQEVGVPFKRLKNIDN